MDSHAFLQALTIVLCTAGVTTVVFQRLKLPVVLGYLIAGLIVGPHLPIPLVADAQIVQTLSELGVILLMFSLGLEFSLRKLYVVGPRAGLTAVLQSSVVVWLGYLSARLLGWGPRESFFVGAAVAISSTTIIAKAFEEQKVSDKLRELVLGVLVVEDLIAILLMAVLTAIAGSEGLSWNTLVVSSARLGAFLFALIAVGLLLVPRLVRWVRRLHSAETTVVACVGLCFASALLAQSFGYSVALGAFLGGCLVAESRQQKHIAHLIEPVRDVFAAVFFVSVGMSFDPAAAWRNWPAVLVLTAVVIGGKLVGVTVGAFLAGNGVRTSVQAGMSLAQIGEFSFIIAGLGLSLGAVGEALYPIAVSVSAITTMTTPMLIRAADPFASLVDRKLPRTLQTFATLYGSWLEQLRSPENRKSTGATARRLARLLVLDAALLAGLVIATALFGGSLCARISGWFEVSREGAQIIVVGAALALAAPFAVGVVRVSRSLGVCLAEVALPKSGGRDLAVAPRRALIVTLQLAIVLLVALPLAALTQPFLPAWPIAAVLFVVLLVLGIAFWRSATELQGHVRAGAEVLAEALMLHARGSGEEDALVEVNQLLPGLGEPESLRLSDSSPAVGRTLGELDLRGRTGASVFAIVRAGRDAIRPSADEKLLAGDVLALAGTHEAVEAARALLEGAAQPASEAREPD